MVGERSEGIMASTSTIACELEQHTSMWYLVDMPGAMESEQVVMITGLVVVAASTYWRSDEP